jgi:hypothetical protein
MRGLPLMLLSGETSLPRQHPIANNSFVSRISFVDFLLSDWNNFSRGSYQIWSKSVLQSMIFARYI